MSHTGPYSYPGVGGDGRGGDGGRSIGGGVGVGAVEGKPFPRPGLSHTGSSVYSQLTQALGLLLYALQQWAQGGNTVNIMMFFIHICEDLKLNIIIFINIVISALEIF